MKNYLAVDVLQKLVRLPFHLLVNRADDSLNCPFNIIDAGLQRPRAVLRVSVKSSQIGCCLQNKSMNEPEILQVRTLQETQVKLAGTTKAQHNAKARSSTTRQMCKFLTHVKETKAN